MSTSQDSKLKEERKKLPEFDRRAEVAWRATHQASAASLNFDFRPVSATPESSAV
jgi:hypothetical protein